ncbi:MAG: stage II sporulation protein M [Flavobacterium sp.]|nr:MAG: stage II sporulation protein M [Flavobacterium sp.]
MTLEIIVFVIAILFGIIIYWRESKSNRLYRFFNHMMHSRELQMKADNRKGFVHKQVFLMRLVWITLIFVLGAAILSFATPINVIFFQYFVSAIVGTLIGTYIASAFIFTSEGLKKENLKKNFDKAVEKGKDFVDDLREEVDPEPKGEDTPENKKDADEKSARDRLKDKGMIK